MFEHLMQQYAECEGITEKLKADNQMEWVQKMNDIRERVTETINYELTCRLKVRLARVYTRNEM